MAGISFREFAKRLLVIVFLILFLLLIKIGIHVFLMVFAGLLLAILWRNLARRLHGKTNLNKKLSLGIVVILNLILFVGIVIILVPQISDQVKELEDKIPTAVDQLISDLEQTQIGEIIVERVNQQFDLSNSDNSDNGDSRILKAFSFFTSMLGAVLDLFIIFIFGIFLTVNPHLYINGFLSLVPPSKRGRIKEVLNQLDLRLFRWFIGKILDMLAVAVMTAIGLILLDMPLVLTFTVLTFFLSFIPNIGPVISAVPPVLVALLDSPQKALYVIILYLFVQLFESYFITPNIQRQAIQMPPLLLLMVQILFAIGLGVLALFLSTPLLATAIVIIQMLYVEDVLEKREQGKKLS